MYVSADAPVNCVFPIKIRGNVRLERLEHALLKLQQKHPLLRVVIQEDEKGMPYYVADTRIPPITIDIRGRHSNDDWQRATVDEWYNRFNVQRGPLARVVWLKSDEVSELLFVCPHCICDGTSILTLVREMLQVMDDPSTELEAYTSFNDIYDLLPPLKTTLKARIIGWIVTIVLRFKAGRPPTPLNRGYLLHWKLSAELSSGIAKRCKEEGTSVFTAMAVAVLEAFRTVKGNKAHNKLICSVDIRRFLPAIKRDQLFAFAPVVLLSGGSSAMTDFWSKSKFFRDDLAAKIGKINIHELIHIGEHFHDAIPYLVNYLKKTNGRHDVTFSNMGRLDLPETHQTFELETVYSPSAAFPWRNPNTLVATACRGQIDFSFISNEAFLPESEARAIQEKAMQILQEQCHIKQAYGIHG